MATFPTTVRTINDGDDVNAATDNGPISDLTQRTSWLKDQLDQLTAGTQLLLRSRTIESGLTAGAPVYFDGVTNQFRGALADVDTSNLSHAASSSFWQGILQTASGTTGDIVVGGSLILTQAEWDTVFEDGSFATGEIFLSATTEGTVTTEEGTVGIYLGEMIDDGAGNGELLVRMGGPNSFLQHVHYQRTALGKPAGTPNSPAMGDPQTIDTPDAAQRGWLPANSTYFPGFVVGVQIPVGAVFGYNMTHASETDLNAVFPFVPADNAQFSQGGLILGSDLVVTNAFGIWWMDNSYGNAPWPVDYNISMTAEDITVWTARLVASSSILDLVSQSIINQLSNGGIDTIAVQSLLSGDATYLTISGTEGDAISGYQGQVTLTNTGVTAMRVGRGLAVSAGAGDNTSGYRLLLDVDFDADLPAQHLYTNVDPANIDPTEKMSLVTTNGVSSGTTLGLYGHRLAAQSADYIDFLIPAGSDLKTGTNYEVSITLQACVDTISGAPTAGEVNVSFYRLVTGSPVSTTQLQRVTQASFNTGLPGQLQTVVVGTFADVFVQRNNQLLVRIAPSTGTPLPTDTFRLVAMYYRLDEV